MQETLVDVKKNLQTPSHVENKRQIPSIAPRSQRKILKTENLSSVTPTQNLSSPMDLAAYIDAKRRSSGRANEPENAETITNKVEAPDETIRMAKVRRNLLPQGTNGVFQILNMGTRTAQFSFRAWKADFSNPRREFIEVNIGLDGDLEHAVIRKMIELIRRYYKGDFKWESHRLNRVVGLSARIEDNIELEDFLMREFFDSGG